MVFKKAIWCCIVAMRPWNIARLHFRNACVTSTKCFVSNVALLLNKLTNRMAGAEACPECSIVQRVG